MHATTETSTRTTSTTATSTTSARRFVDPDDLICPGCGEQVRCASLAFWQVSDGLPVAEFSHADRTALCRTVAGRIVEPVEVAR